MHEEGPTEPFGNHADIDPDEVNNHFLIKFNYFIMIMLLLRWMRLMKM